MRLGRKLAEGVAVDREAERLAAVTERPGEAQARATAPIVTASITAALAEDLPADRPARV